MADILNRIGETKMAEIAAAKARLPLAEVKALAASATPPRGFAAAIKTKLAGGESALIAEVKKASPSRGLIRADFDPAGLARAYAAGGAACLSVLTDSQYFQGGSADLVAARAAVKLPVLRKDFMYDPYQVYEARAWGADAVLVILAAVDDHTGMMIEETAARLGMDTLFEVHNEAELERALHYSSPLVGINNRDLHTFETSLTVSERLAPMVPDDRVIVGESGIFTAADLARLARFGVRTYLVGESLMRQTDVAAATAALLSRTPASVAG